MTSTSNGYIVPRQRFTEEGNIRRVGFELEFAGLTLKQTVAVLASVFDTQATTNSVAHATVPHERWGNFGVEVDSELAQTLARERADYRRSTGKQEVGEDSLAEWLVNLTTELVPVEVVCPPIAMDELPMLDPMVDALRDAGAEGTAGALHYAFGVHINSELPGLSPSLIARYIQAYVIAQDWLVERHEVDLTRRVTPYVNLYPAAYGRLVLDYDEHTTLDRLITDYLKHNRTRNRALDLLPLFTHMDEDRIRQAIDDSRIKARPTFHYRLPNCHIDRPGWRLAEGWQIWCVVEALAQDAGLLAELASQYRDYDSNLINLGKPPWHNILDSLLVDLASA
jgi:hypothetical protein